MRMIPPLDEPFISVTQAQYGLTRQFNDIRNTPAMDLLRNFIRTYVGDYWGYEGRPQWSRRMWEDNITDMINDQEELLWNLEELGLMAFR